MTHMPLDASATQCVDTPDPDPRCGSRWGVVHTHPQAEKWCKANLLQQGFKVWWLIRWVTRPDPVTRTMTHRVEVPLFTSYVFVAIPSLWAPIRHTLGVRQLLMDGPNPYLLPERAESLLRAAEEFSATQPPDGALWHPGDAVAPSTGPFAGHPAVVTEILPGNRAMIALLLFGELRQVSVDVSSLVARE